MYNGKYDIAFPKQSETQNLVMVNKNFDIYILLYFRGRLRTLAVLLDKCLLTDVFLFYKIICCIQRHIFSIISQMINFLFKFSVVTQILESAFRWFHLSSCLVPRLKCMDASGCSHM